MNLVCLFIVYMLFYLLESLTFFEMFCLFYHLLFLLIYSCLVFLIFPGKIFFFQEKMFSEFTFIFYLVFILFKLQILFLLYFVVLGIRNVRYQNLKYRLLIDQLIKHLKELK